MNDKVDVMVGRRLRKRRRLLGKTQQDVAAACGLTFQQIQSYEGADAALSVAILWRLACVLGVDVGYFFVDLPQDLGVDDDASRGGGRPPGDSCIDAV